MRQYHNFFLTFLCQRNHVSSLQYLCHYEVKPIGSFNFNGFFQESNFSVQTCHPGMIFSWLNQPPLLQDSASHRRSFRFLNSEKELRIWRTCHLETSRMSSFWFGEPTRHLFAAQLMYRKSASGYLIFLWVCFQRPATSSHLYTSACSLCFCV